MASSSSPSGHPSDPPHSLSSKIKQAFHHASMVISGAKAAFARMGNNSSILPLEGGQDTHRTILPTDSMQVIMIPSCNVGYRMATRWGSRASYRQLPLYYVNASNSADQMQRCQSKNSAGLAKMFLNLTFQAAVAFAAFSFQSSSSSSPNQAQNNPPFQLLHIAEVVMVIGFAACFIGMLLRHTYPLIGSVSEKIGVLVSALGLFLVLSTLLPSYLIWIALLVGIVSLLAFVLAFIR